MMPSWLQEWLAQGPVLTDGAWGTQLQQQGLQAGELPDAWNIARPEAVLEVARSYVAAGSQVILTNTFSANRCRLAEYGLADKQTAINREGVRLSRQAAGRQARVFASLGPSGKILLAGDVSPEDLFTIFAEQARTLAEAGADALVVETMADLEEARLAVSAAKATGLPIVACMVFDSGREKDRTLMGVTPEQAARGLTAAGADIVGANCGQGIAGFLPICRRLRAATDRPIWIKANAGLPELVEGRPVWRTTPAEFASFAPALLQAGAAFLGGCCGTTPDFIRALRQIIC